MQAFGSREPKDAAHRVDGLERYKVRGVLWCGGFCREYRFVVKASTCNNLPPNLNPGKGVQMPSTYR
jgi:hypothetical protein